MADSYSSKLQIWEGWEGPLARPATTLVVNSERGLTMTAHPIELADDLFAQETFSHRRRLNDASEPYTLQWFLDIEAFRYARHGHWIPRLLEVAKHAGDRVLGLGPGLGTDWVQYARHGAKVIACTRTAGQLQLVQRHFEVRGLTAQFVQANPVELPVETSSIDVVCLGSLVEADEDAAAVVKEVYRVLKPGGKVLAMGRSHYDADFWCYRWQPWSGWLRPRRSEANPGQPYKARQLRKLFGRFIEQRIHKRHLRRSDVPHLWRWLPLPMLERVMGKFLILKAFKPLSSAIITSLAA